MRGVSFPYMTKNYTDCAFARTMAERARTTTIIRHIPSATAFTYAHDMARATVTHALPQQNARIRWAANRLGKHASTPSQLFGNACAPRARLSPNRMVQILDDTSSMSTVSGRGHNGRLTHDLDVAGFSGRCRDNSHALNECAGTSVPAHPTFLVQSTG
jgi:hypothetical protein